MVLYLWEAGPRAYASQEAGFPQAPHSGGTVGKTGLSKTCGVHLCFGDRILEWVRVRIQNTNCYEQLGVSSRNGKNRTLRRAMRLRASALTREIPRTSETRAKVQRRTQS